MTLRLTAAKQRRDGSAIAAGLVRHQLGTPELVDLLGPP
jgi:hypothetical protein